jgi:hypothetical protein
VRDDISGAGSLEPLGNDVTAASDAAGETPREPAPAAAGANPCPLDPPAPPAGIFEEPNRSADDVADLTPMEAFADQKATAYLEGFTAGAYPAVDEFDPLSPYCLGVEAFLRAQREDAAGEPPSYDGTGLDRAVDFYLGYVTGVFPDGGDDVHPFVQGVAERLRDDPIARAAAEARAVAPAAVEENAAAAGGGVYDASGDAAQTVGDVSGNDVVVQTEGAVSGNAAVEQTVGDVSGNGSVSQTVGDVS